MGLTTIAVQDVTKEHLQVLGNKGQTYDEIVQSLIEVAEKSSFFEKQKTILETEKFVKLDEI